MADTEGLYPGIVDFEKLYTNTTGKMPPKEIYTEFIKYRDDRMSKSIALTSMSKKQGEKTGKNAIVSTINKPCILTIRDFVTVWLGKSIDWWVKLDKGRNARYYRVVKNYITTYIKEHKFKGAAVGIFNSQLIIRDLGLADKVTHEMTNIRDEDLTEEEMQDRLACYEKIKDDEAENDKVLNKILGGKKNKE